MMRKLIKLVATLLGYFILFQIVIRLLRQRLKFPAPAFIGYALDSDARRKIQPPHQLIKWMGVSEGMRVLEMGCGSGAFTTFVARAVGPQGKVYALDIARKMLEQLEKKLSRPENQDIHNVELLKKSAYDMPFEDNELDMVYTIAALQEIPNRSQALKEVKRVLKPGGIFSVSELLIDPDYPLVTTTIRQVTEAGFVMEFADGNLIHYTVRFRKPNN